MISMQIENAQVVQNALDKFEDKIAKKIVRDGLRAAYNPALKKAKANVRALDKGTIKGKKKSERIGHKIANTLKLSSFKKQKPGRYGLHIWVDPKQAGQFVKVSKKTGHRNYIPMAIEYGHAFPYRGLGPGGGAPKDVPARPWMRPAIYSELYNIQSIFKRHIVRAIREENMKR